MLTDAAAQAEWISAASSCENPSISLQPAASPVSEASLITAACPHKWLIFDNSRAAPLWSGHFECVQNLTNHCILHCRVSSLFFRANRLFSEMFYTLYSRLIVSHSSSWSVANNWWSINKQYVPSCIALTAVRREGSSPTRHANVNTSRASQCKLGQTSLFLHLKMLIQGVFTYKYKY